MSEIAQLLVPAIRWDAARGFDAARREIENALALGVGGFVLFGGEQESVRGLTKWLRQQSRTPLLIAADMERGAGQQFSGATGLPPLAAIAWLNDLEALKRAARHTAREARTLGVSWDFAPVADLDLEPRNPILGTRALGAEPARVGRQTAAWITACQAEGVLACAKHFPGHGRTVSDSHTELPVVSTSRGDLMSTDLVPFRAAIEAGVASIMTAHVAYPALDPTGVPATLSREIIQWLLRQQMRFEGLIVSDSLVMAGALVGRTEEQAAIAALSAGCDVLLYPSDPVALARALERAVASGAVPRDAVQQSLRRRLKWAQWASPPNEYRKPMAADVAWCAQLAERVVHTVRGDATRIGSPVEVIIVDDDAGAASPVPRDAFVAALTGAGWNARTAETPTSGGARSTIIALFGDVLSSKGRLGFSARTRERVRELCGAAPAALTVMFSHPRLAAEIPEARHLLCAWGGELAMQEAAARVIARQRPA
jgi:beta-glucosidase-like glycosyl hydrolase